MTLFQTIEITDEMAAVQFCTYLEGNAYKFWESLPEEITSNLKKTLKAFDRKYADEIQQGYWQIKYENLTYAGPEKESLDDLAMRIQDVVKKAFPDYIDEKGQKTSKLQTRQIYAKKKFWDLMATDIKEQLFIKFKGSDAPLQEQLDYARILQAAKIRANKEEQSYETLCVAEYQQPQYKVLAELQKQSRQIDQISRDMRTPQQSKQEGDKNKPRQQTTQETQQGQVSQNPNIQCYNCGENGHINRYCPYVQQRMQQQGQGTYPSPLLPTPRIRQWNPRPGWQNTGNWGGRQNWNQGSYIPNWNQGGYTPNWRGYQPGPRWNQNPSWQQNQQWNSYGQRQGNQGWGNTRGQVPQRGGYSRYGQQFQGNQRMLPSRSGHPQDLREKKAPMHTMPVQRVPPKEYKPQVNMCETEEEVEFRYDEYNMQDNLN